MIERHEGSPPDYLTQVLASFLDGQRRVRLLGRTPKPKQEVIGNPQPDPGFSVCSLLFFARAGPRQPLNLHSKALTRLEPSHLTSIVPQTAFSFERSEDLLKGAGVEV